MLTDAEKRRIGTFGISNKRDLAEHFKVQVPPGVSGSVEVRNVKFDEQSPWPRPGARPRHGVYTEMLRGGQPWMSDYPSETVGEQFAFLSALNRAPRDSRILVLGLGLGVVIRAALLMLHKGPIDVVEIDADVLALVQPHYEEAAGFASADVRFHLADAFVWDRAGVDRWHIGWADVWRDLSEENLPGIERMAALYGPRCVWYDSWSRVEGEYLKAHRKSVALPIPGIPVVARRPDGL